MNQDMIDRWNGPEADHWVDNADRYDGQFEPFLHALNNAVGPDPLGDVLDIGCGCGELTMTLATRATSATGVDISSRLLNIAELRAVERGIPNVGFVTADAQNWEPSSIFDLIVSRFGVMFFDDPAAAFTNLHRMLAPEGRIVFACWQGLGEQPWLLEAGAAAAPHLSPGPPPVAGPGMFALADRTTIHTLLAGAGFSNVEIQDHHTPMYIGGPGSVADATHFFAGTGIARTMLDGATPEAAALAIHAVTAVMTTHHDGVGVNVDTATWIVTATS